MWCSIDKDDPAFAQGVRALRNAVIWRNHRAGYSKLAVRHCAISYVIEFTNAIGTGRSIQNYMKNWAAFIHKPVTQALNYIGCMVLVTAASGPVIRQDRAFLESLTKQPAQVGHFYHIQANATNAAPPPWDVDGIVGGLPDLIVYLEAVQKVLNAITKSRETGGEFNISWLISQAYTSR